MTTVGIVGNAHAGNGRSLGLVDRLRDRLNAAGHTTEIVTAPDAETLIEAVLAAAPSLGAIVAVGGDGTMHIALQAAVRHGIPLGIVPAGSGNDTARALRLTDDAHQAIDDIVAGLGREWAAVDAGHVRVAGIERYFLGILSCGIDAAVADRVATSRVPGSLTKYLWGAIAEISRFRPYRVRVASGDREWTEPSTLVAVANGPHFGAGMTLAPQSSLTDGTLELVLAESMSRRAILPFLPRLLQGTATEDPRVSVHQVTSVTIEPMGPDSGLPAASADGERLGRGPLTVEVVPGAVRVIGVIAR